MMKYLVYIAVFLLPISIFGQDSSIEIGGGVGVSSYYGDINQERTFYNPKLALDGLIRFNFNKRYAVRFGMLASKIEANDLDFDNPYQQYRNKSFFNQIYETSIVGEVNFFPYKNTDTKGWGNRGITIYSLLGFSSILSIPSEHKNNYKKNRNVPTIIWGVGCKKFLGRRWAIEVEWAFRKCLNDKFDGIEDPINSGKKSAFFNNDFYNVLGVRLVYSLWEAGGKCRTFERDSDL